MPRARLMPVFVARTPLLTDTPLRHAQSGQSAMVYVELDTQRKTLAALGQTIADKLSAVVPMISDSKRRASVIRIRREFFNASVSSRSIEEIRTEVRGTSLEHAIESYAFEMHKHKETENSADLTFQRERQATVRQLVTLVRKNEDFAKALSLSSPSLFDAMARYAQPLLSDVKRTAKLRSIERTLLQYGVRASTKCTPFSRFGVVMLGKVDLGGRELDLTTLGSVGVDRTNVQLNLELLDSLTTRLTRTESLSQALELRLDELVKSQIGREEFEFLVTRGKREFVSKVRTTEPLAKLVEMLSSEASVSVGKLSNKMHELTKGIQSQERHRQTIAALLRGGIFVPAIVDDYSVEAWLLSLKRMCKGQRGPIAKAARRELDAAVNAVHAVAQGSAPERNRALQLVYSVINESRPDEKVSGVTASTQARTPVFEDAASESVLQLSLGPNSTYVTHELQVLCDTAHRLGWPRGEQATMRRYFEKTFSGKSEVPLFFFYVSYYKDHMREHLRREEENRRGHRFDDSEIYSLSNPLGVPLVEKLSTANRRLRGLLRSLTVAGDPEVFLSLEALQEIAEIVPQCRNDEYSFALFCHLADLEMPRLLIPGGKVAVGFGKYYSRFTGMLDPVLRTRLLESASSFSGEVSEIYHCQRFNANLHEPLTPAVVGYPNSSRPTGWPTFHIGDLTVRSSSTSDDELELRSRVTGELVRPVDLGFISPRLRPPLLQMLTRFGPQRGFTVGFPQPAELVNLGESGRLAFPRLNFGRSLTLSRRQWRFACRSIPVPEGSSFDRLAHQTLLRWCRGCEAPEQFFATFHSGLSGEGKKNQIEKAQFFQLSDPLMAEYFVRLVIQSIDGCLVVEEALPSIGSSQSPRPTRTCELILHFEKSSEVSSRSV